MDQLIQLADYGVMGTLLVVSILSNIYLFKTVMQLQDKRLEDAVAVKKNVMDTLTSMKDTLSSVITLLNLIAKNEKTAQ